MLEYFQPKLLNERNVDNVVGVRTTYQIFLQILRGVKNQQMVIVMFYFIFGKKTRWTPADVEELEDDRARNLLDGLKDEESFDLLKEENDKIEEK